MMTDPIADMLARIRNAYLALHGECKVPASKAKAEVSRILKEEGYIDDFAQKDRDLKLVLKYSGGKPLIVGMKRISKPGRRVYVGVEEIPKVQNGLGICIVSTSRGILEGETARKENVGGEVLCEIW